MLGSEMSMQASAADRRRLAELLKKELEVVEASTSKSRELYQRALASMPMGVASSYQARARSLPRLRQRRRGLIACHGRRADDDRFP